MGALFTTMMSWRAGEVKTDRCISSNCDFERAVGGMPRIVANGRPLFYEESGQGEPLLFLSGLGGDHRAFSVTLRHFGTQYRALALDTRDAGQSDRSEGPYSTAEMAEDVLG